MNIKAAKEALIDRMYDALEDITATLQKHREKLRRGAVKRLPEGGYDLAFLAANIRSQPQYRFNIRSELAAIYDSSPEVRTL